MKEQSDSLGKVVLDEDVSDDNYENQKQEMIDAVNQKIGMTKGHKELLELEINYAAALEKFEEKIRPQDAPIERL